MKGRGFPPLTSHHLSPRSLFFQFLMIWWTWSHPLAPSVIYLFLPLNSNRLFLSLSHSFIFPLMHYIFSDTASIQFNCRHANAHFDDNDADYSSPSVPFFPSRSLSSPHHYFWFVWETQKIKIGFSKPFLKVVRFVDGGGSKFYPHDLTMWFCLHFLLYWSSIIYYPLFTPSPFFMNFIFTFKLKCEFSLFSLKNHVFDVGKGQIHHTNV